jgi:protein-L-isoaspartate(D-aspartate) O-methyltransferase
MAKSTPAGLKAGAAHGQSLVLLEKTPQGVRQTVLEAVHFVPLKSGLA